MHVYPAQLAHAADGITVTFRDIPEAITSGRTVEEALAMGADALATALDFYFEDRRTVPAPSPMLPSDMAVPLSATLTLKVLLLNAMLAARVTPSMLARRMLTTPSVVTRIIEPRHATKLDTLAKALEVTGYHLEMSARQMPQVSFEARFSLGYYGEIEKFGLESRAKTVAMNLNHRFRDRIGMDEPDLHGDNCYLSIVAREEDAASVIYNIKILAAESKAVVVVSQPRRL